MHPYQTEQALAAALARRQEDAAEQLVREYGGLLNAVARYRAIDAVRRAARTRPAGGAQELERLVGHTADEYFALELEDMFRGLPAEDRALLLGRYFYGSTPAELAAARGISVGAVNTRVARARQRRARLRERSGEK